MGVLYQWGEQSKWVGQLPVQAAGSLLMLEALFILWFILEGGVKKAGGISGAKSRPTFQALPSTKHCNISYPAELNLKIKYAITSSSLLSLLQ